MPDQHDDLDEGMEPPDPEEEPGKANEASKENPTPMHIALFFTGADDGELVDVIEAVIQDAVSRGLFYVWGAQDEVAETDVVKGSPLWQAVTGREF